MEVYTSLASYSSSRFLASFSLTLRLGTPLRITGNATLFATQRSSVVRQPNTIPSCEIALRSGLKKRATYE